MKSKRQHIDALCRLLDARLAAAPPAAARRLLRPQVRWAAERPDDDELAAELGVLALVDKCRDDYLASLDADEGLAVLAIGWAEVAVAFAARDDRSPARCSRCAARVAGGRCRRCGLTRGVSDRRTHG
jgi:hypothetical protein